MTQHHHTPPPDPMPLDPEERALAARLARLGPHGEPSPALDARVLAAAHAATSGGGARVASAGRRRGEREHGWRRARWPVGVGVAASVVLAAGIAWQMRPLPAPVVPMTTHATVAATATDAADSTATMPAAAMVAQPSPVPPGPPPQDTFSVAARETAAAPSKPADARTAAAAKKSLPPPEEPAVVFDEPSPVDVQAPPPAPPAPPAPMASPVTAATAPVAAQRQQAAARPAASAPQAQAPEAPVFDTGADAPEADVPPATAASPAVRDAWLARIRELAAAGRTDEARASLAEFRHRYPAYAVPEDLRPLLPATAPSPSPQQ